MSFVYIALIALVNNVDNIGVRIAYSVRGINISNSKNLYISIITFVISSISAFSGSMLSSIMSKSVASYISMTLLISIGVFIIVEPFMKRKNNDNTIMNILKDPGTADMDNSKDIDYKEATLLGIALSINNIGGCISAGMIGLNSLIVGLMSAVISFGCLWAGNYVTKFISKRFSPKSASTIAGIVLIVIGLTQVI